jgi:MerR family transcriptional regulator, light-induced transcriptional regulator
MVRTNAAARLLGVSASTLRSWERRYGFPRPERSAGGHRQYALDEIQSLRQALDETAGISSAIELARRRGLGPSSRARLSAAFASFDEPLADRLLEESLALRSVERTVQELLLPAVGDQGESAYEFAWRHAFAWLSAQRRLASPTPTQAPRVLILDAWPTCDLDTLQALALELVLRRTAVVTLCVGSATGAALRALRPLAVILAGRRATLDEAARQLYAIRRAVPGIQVFDYRRTLPDTGASTVARLGDSPLEARDALVAWLHGGDLPRPRKLTAV